MDFASSDFGPAIISKVKQRVKVNPSTPKFKKYILPTFLKSNV